MITVLVALSVGFIAGFVTAFVWSHTWATLNTPSPFTGLEPCWWLEL